MPFGIQPSFAGGEIAPSVAGRIDIAKYHVALATAYNMIVQAEGGIHNRQGLRFVWQAYNSDKPSRLIPFSYSTVQNYVIELAENRIRFFRDGGIIVYSDGPQQGQPVELVTDYSQDDLWRISFTQSADIMTLVHPAYPVRELKRFAHDNWLLEDVVFGPLIAAPENVAASKTSGSNGTRSETYVVTAFDEYGIEESNRSAEATTAANIPDSGWTVTVTWDAVEGAEYYHVYRNESGIFQFVGRSEGTSFDDENFTPDADDAAPTHREPFGETVNDNPGAVSYHKQRRVFGATVNDPQTNWFTKIANFYNMNTSTPTQDDDAIRTALVGGTPTNQVNEIRHYVSFSDLLVFTSGAVWTISSGSDPFAPGTITQNPQSYRGSTYQRPLVIEDTVLYMQTGSIVRDIGYKFESDSYSGSDLSVLAKHMFENHTFIDWTYAQSPDSVVWLTRNDGVMLGMTYLREHQIWAWHRHGTDGKFRSVTSVLEGEEDRVYVCVEREVDGQTVHYIELLSDHEHIGDPNPVDQFYVDSGLSYDGAPANTFSGFDHLEGREISALADGNVYHNLLVTGGEISLPDEVTASKLHGGLPYLSEMETLNIDFRTDDGTVQGRDKSIPKVILNVLNSRGFWIGPTRDDMVEAKWRTDEGYDEPTELYTGMVEVELPSLINEGGQFVVQQRDPLPLYVLSAIPEVMLED